MSIDMHGLLDRVNQVSLGGLVASRLETIGADNQEIIIIELLKIRRAIKERQKGTDLTMLKGSDAGSKDCFRMIIGIDNPVKRPNDLKFVVPDIAVCKPLSIDHTLYLEANYRLYFGAHKWNPEDNKILFSYIIPIPEGHKGFPDVSLLQRMIPNIYEGLLYHDLTELLISITQNDLLSADEKRMKTHFLEDTASLLQRTEAGDEGAV